MQNTEYFHRIILGLILVVSSLLSPMTTQAAELLMVEEPGCVYCARFNREIGPAYPKTDEGKRAPLRRLQLHEPWPLELKSVRKATVTPTFILVENGKELDRLVGYPGDEYFWFLLAEMLEKL